MSDLQAQSRFHYMDNLRALAMIAGVFFHAALAYSVLVHDFFPTADSVQSRAFDVFAWFMHLFRMPLFFVVSGFFSALLITRYAANGMLKNRLRKIVLPFIVFWPLIYISLEKLTLHAARTLGNPSPILELIKQALAMENIPAQAPTTSHLWFLYYLAVFNVLLWAVSNLELHKLSAKFALPKPMWMIGVAPLALLPALLSVTAPFPAPESFFPTLWAFGFFGVYFTAGYWLYFQEHYLDQIQRSSLLISVLSLAMSGLYFFLLGKQNFVQIDYTLHIILCVLQAYLGVYLTLLSLIIGKCFLQNHNRFMRYIANASYWVYIVHLPILFAIQYALLDIQANIAVKFTVAVGATLLIAFVSYHFMVRNTYVGVLLTGRPRSQANQ